ncbi:MAG: hypothetical protein K0R27_4414 [Xanthobacteraceae bacterium]|jgi:hypothetical protein|nr:hypothetical protein [Xanthobacteraceae bacterium]
MRRALLRGGRRCAILACAGSLAAGLLLATPAGAQWIGSAGGDGSPPAKPPTAPLAPAPAAAASAPAAASAAPAPDATLGAGFDSPGMAAPGFGELPNGGLAAPGGFSPAQRGPSADCQTNVNALRGDVEKNGDSLKAAAKRKRPPNEVCPLFRRFVASQQKFYDYLAKNKSNCSVPDSALKSLKTNLAQVTTTRDKVCEVAANGPPPGAAPATPQGMLSQGLNLPSGLPSISADRPGGVYDTLGGNALR